MPTATNITTSYAGQWAGKYVSAALLSAPTIEGGAVTVMPNVKYKAVIQRIESNDILKDATCDFTPTSTVDLTERVLEVKDLQVNLTFCKSQFHSTWQSIEMGYSSFDTLPKSFSDYLFAYAAEKVAAANEVSIWRGSSSTSGQFDGLFTTAQADVNLPLAQNISGIIPSSTITRIRPSSNSYSPTGTAIFCSSSVTTKTSLPASNESASILVTPSPINICSNLISLDNNALIFSSSVLFFICVYLDKFLSHFYNVI